MLSIHSEVGTMLQLLEFNKKKMQEEKSKSPSKFITNLEPKTIKRAIISAFLTTKKNMMLSQPKLHHIVL
jgi:hypothetical protein